MSEPIYSPTTERAFSRLPQIFRDTDAEQMYPESVGEVKQAYNYAINPSFENVAALTRYPAENCVAQSSTTWHMSGDRSLQLVNNSAAERGRLMVMSASELRAGQTYTASAVVWSSTPTPRNEYPYKTIEFAMDGVVLASKVSTYRYGAERVTISFTVPSNMTVDSTGGLYLYNGGVQGEPDVYWDDLLVTDGTGYTEYFDGDSEGAVWSGGVRHTSASIRLPVESQGGGWPLKRFYGAVCDVLGDVDRLTARFTYLPSDARAKGVSFEYDDGDRAVPMGETSDLVDARTADPEWLAWIGQLTGVNVDAYSDTDDLRRAVMDSDSGYRAGSRDALIATTKTVLSGPWDEREVRIYPASTSPLAIGQATQWDLLIVTRGAVSPPTPTLLAAIHRSGSKPAGVVLHHAVLTTTWDNVEAAYPVWATWDGKAWIQIEDAGLGG